MFIWKFQSTPRLHGRFLVDEISEYYNKIGMLTKKFALTWSSETLTEFLQKSFGKSNQSVRYILTEAKQF